MQKSTQGVALASIFLLFPFSIYNLIQGNYLLGTLGLFITVIFTINAWLCFRGQYNQLIMLTNLFGMAPFMTITVVFALDKYGAAGSYWSYMALLSFYFILPERLAWVTNIIFLAIIIPAAWITLEHAETIRFSTVLLGVSLFAAILIREITKQYDMLKEQAVTDTLTGLYNRSLLQNSLEQAIHQNRRNGTPMSLLMVDLDHFKLINDELGHDNGDSVLIKMGEFLKNHFRASDMVFRIGGEEFLVLIYNADELASVEIAEKLRKKIELLSLIPARTVTASIGVSVLKPDISWGEWVKCCDENLYRAKVGGRNQVVAGKSVPDSN